MNSVIKAVLCKTEESCHSTFMDLRMFLDIGSTIVSKYALLRMADHVKSEWAAFTAENSQFPKR